MPLYRVVCPPTQVDTPKTSRQRRRRPLAGAFVAGALAAGGAAAAAGAALGFATSGKLASLDLLKSCDQPPSVLWMAKALVLSAGVVTVPVAVLAAYASRTSFLVGSMLPGVPSGATHLLQPEHSTSTRQVAELMVDDDSMVRVTLGSGLPGACSLGRESARLASSGSWCLTEGTNYVQGTHVAMRTVTTGPLGLGQPTISGEPTTRCRRVNIVGL